MTVNNKQGFTLIELLIVVVIIGILAAIAIPKFSATREKAYVSAMKADLRNVATAMDLYYSSDNDADLQVDYQYVSDAASPGVPFANIDASASEGVSITITQSATQQGWEAVATHQALGAGISCVVYHGDVAAAPTTAGGLTPASPGQISCDPV